VVYGIAVYYSKALSARILYGMVVVATALVVVGCVLWSIG
jgi:hypothetical protein